MIKHHPNLKLLQSFSAGELPASLSAAISIHVDMCPVCQEKVTELTEQFAENCFDQDMVEVNDLNVDSSPMLALMTLSKGFLTPWKKCKFKFQDG